MHITHLPAENLEQIFLSIAEEGRRACKDIDAASRTCRVMHAAGARVLWRKMKIKMETFDGRRGVNPLARVFDKLTDHPSIAPLVRIFSLDGIMFDLEDGSGDHCEIPTTLILELCRRLPLLHTLILYGITCLPSAALPGIPSPKCSLSVQTLSISRFLQASHTTISPIDLLPLLPRLKVIDLDFHPFCNGVADPATKLALISPSAPKVSLSGISPSIIPTAVAVLHGGRYWTRHLKLELVSEYTAKTDDPLPAPLLLPSTSDQRG